MRLRYIFRRCWCQHLNCACEIDYCKNYEHEGMLRLRLIAERQKKPEPRMTDAHTNLPRPKHGEKQAHALVCTIRWTIQDKMPFCTVSIISSYLSREKNTMLRLPTAYTKLTRSRALFRNFLVWNNCWADRRTRGCYKCLIDIAFHFLRLLDWIPSTFEFLTFLTLIISSD